MRCFASAAFSFVIISSLTSVSLISFLLASGRTGVVARQSKALTLSFWPPITVREDRDPNSAPAQRNIHTLVLTLPSGPTSFALGRRRVALWRFVMKTSARNQFTDTARHLGGRRDESIRRAYQDKPRTLCP